MNFLKQLLLARRYHSERGETIIGQFLHEVRKTAEWQALIEENGSLEGAVVAQRRAQIANIMEKYADSPLTEEQWFRAADWVESY